MDPETGRVLELVFGATGLAVLGVLGKLGAGLVDRILLERKAAREEAKAEREARVQERGAIRAERRADRRSARALRIALDRAERADRRLMWRSFERSSERLERATSVLRGETADTSDLPPSSMPRVIPHEGKKRP